MYFNYISEQKKKLSTSKQREADLMITLFSTSQLKFK